MSWRALRLECLATTDPLIGQANRRNWLARAEIAQACPRRQAGVPTVVLCDTGHFKQVSDGHGAARRPGALRGGAAARSRLQRPWSSRSSAVAP